MAAGNSPVMASVETNGSLNGPATIHLLNPVGSGKRLTVRKLRVNISVGTIVKMRRTNSPILFNEVAQTLVSDTPIRMNEADATAVTGVFEGTNFPHQGDTFTIAQSQWVFLQDTASQGLPIVRASDLGITIEPGSAVEVTSHQFGAGIILRVHCIWDEELL